MTMRVDGILAASYHVHNHKACVWPNSKDTLCLCASYLVPVVAAALAICCVHAAVPFMMSAQQLLRLK